MNQPREIKSFIHSLYFSDGIRITLGVLLPSLILAQFGQLITGITISLGAFSASLGDNPGPWIHKRNGMLGCIFAVIFTGFVTGLLNSYPALMMVGLFIFCFFFSMLSIYGDRAANVGTAALLVVVLTIDDSLTLGQNLFHAVYLFIGGIWYLGLSMSVLQIRPYRMAQQTLANCIEEVASYLQVKASFYDINEDYDETYQKLIAQQVVVNQQQYHVRELLFKTRQIVKESTSMGRKLVLVFVDIVDLFEQTMATHYEYGSIRKTFGQTGVLIHFKEIILKVAEELNHLSLKLLSNEIPEPLNNFQSDLEKLKTEIDKVESEFGLNNLVLKKILINVRNIVNRIQKIYSYFQLKLLSADQTKNLELSQFVSHNEFDYKLFRENLTFESGIFRHSVRVAIVSVIGYLFSIALPLGHHSYWILLTILTILKPGFSLTKQRNFQRLTGTFFGGIVGALIVIFIKDDIARFILLLVFMVGAYTFIRQNYIVGILFLTPYIIILFSFLGLGGLSVARERIFDTIVGSVIAFTASYYIFPSWEYRQLKGLMKQILMANYKYLYKAGEKLAGRELDVTEYKLVRKEVYVSSANISSAFQRMLSEPKSKQKNGQDLHKFVVLNHKLSSYIASLLASLQRNENHPVNTAHIKSIKKALYLLAEAVNKLNPEDKSFKETDLSIPENSIQLIEDTPDNKLLNEELEYVLKVSKDINRICEKLS
ncbi:FUSC family membrane protein [Rubrolithibacter danxiaensis]|uniref:FUSC family protein n=1 Tax=Rubrolithibacter danxiaensis TaxID=3390805 RepID=UPI003BF84A6C